MVNGWWATALAASIVGIIGTAAVVQAMFSSIGTISRRGDLVDVAQDLVDHNLKWFVASTLLSGLAVILGAITLRALVARQERYAEHFGLLHATPRRRTSPSPRRPPRRLRGGSPILRVATTTVGGMATAGPKRFHRADRRRPTDLTG